MAKIYISSTFGDLEDYRAAVYSALRALRHDVIAMEDYIATDRRPLDKCLDDVTACDVYVGIFAWRYGFVPDRDNPEKKSITELEYRRAVETGKPCLLFLVAENAPWPYSLIEQGQGHEHIKAFRQELAHNYTVSFFENSDELSKKVVTAVANLSPARPVTNPLKGLTGALKALEQLAQRSSGAAIQPLETAAGAAPVQATAGVAPVRRPIWKKLVLAVALLLVVLVGAFVIYQREPASAELFEELFKDQPRFYQTWTTPPTGWNISKGDQRLYLENQPLVGFPTGVHVDDFWLQFHLRFGDEKGQGASGAAWAVRITGRDYYLFYLTGPEHDSPGYLLLYNVRDDKLDLTRPNGRLSLPIELTTEAEYVITLSARGNSFTHWIQPTIKPSPDSLGYRIEQEFRDEENNFSEGGIGFRTVGPGEQFSLAELRVWPGAQMPQ